MTTKSGNDQISLNFLPCCCKIGIQKEKHLGEYKMPLGEDPQCAACKINQSLMWRKGSNGETLCNGCHLKRVTTNTRSQRQSSRESRKLVARIRAGSRKGHWNGKGGERSRERGRRSMHKTKRKVCVS